MLKTVTNAKGMTMVTVIRENLETALNEANVTKAKFAEAAGYMSAHAMMLSIKKGSTPLKKVERACATLCININDICEHEDDAGQEVASTTAPAPSSGIEQYLSRIADALEEIATSSHHKYVDEPTLTDIERCTLLLKVMVCYGSCNEDDFICKAESYKMNAATRAMAIKAANVKTTQRGGENWLVRT